MRVRFPPRNDQTAPRHPTQHWNDISRPPKKDERILVLCMGTGRSCHKTTTIVTVAATVAAIASATATEKATAIWSLVLYG